jgi:citrate synthase
MWKTAITQIHPNEVRLRGYRIDELMGQISFAEAIYLTLKGDLPSPAVGRLMNAMLVSSVDHGATPPSVVAARTAASTGAPLNAAVAAGVLSINRFHGGAIEGCMLVLLELIRRGEAKDLGWDEVADELLAEYRAEKKRIPGFGHRIHSDDPRTSRLFALAEEADIKGPGVEAISALRRGFERQDKQLPINVDGAIAAVLVDLDFDPSVANAFFIMARVPGLVAHVREEAGRQRPMRRVDPERHEYDGPEARSLEA